MLITSAIFYIEHFKNKYLVFFQIKIPFQIRKSFIVINVSYLKCMSFHKTVYLTQGTTLFSQVLRLVRFILVLLIFYNIFV